MRKLSIIVFLMFSLLLSGMSQAMSVDVTAPGDTVKGVPDDGDWPAGELPDYTIDDNAGTKYLHFKGHLQPTGFAVTTRIGGMVVTEITFTTANDSPHRDPVSFELHGSNDSIDGPWTLIASGDIVDFAQADPWPRFTKNATPITFANAVAYDHYQVLFTAVRDPGANNFMQIAEVELLADVTPVTGWAYRDIATSGGNAWEDGGTITIRADGDDIWDVSDGFGYLFRPLLADGYLDVNLVDAGNTNASGWSKVGPMIRETLEGGSRHGMAAMTGTNGIQFVWRLNPNGPSSSVVKPGQSPPKLLRIERSGDMISAKYWGLALPGMPPMWVPVGVPQTIVMGSDVYIGIAVCAGNSAALNYGVLNNVVLNAPPVEIPWDMKPEDGADPVSLTPTLSWMAGDSATSHDVYLGTDPAALPLVGTVTDPEYPIGTELLAKTTYYWQVVEQPLSVAGPVYSFTTEYVPPWYAGTLNWERWNGMPWEEVMRMVDGVHYLLDPADDYGEVPDAYQPSTTGPEDYGVRMSGHLIPGTSGDYTFWVAGDDGVMLSLNTNPDVAELTRIAWHYRYSGNPDANPEQKSVPIYLEAGQNYAIEILLKERGGGDWVEAYWEGPDTEGNRIRISGDFLTNAYATNARPEINTGRNTITPLEATTLTWTAGKYATSQEVLFGTDPAAMVSIATLPADPTVVAEHCTLAMPAVAAGNTYYWQVNSTDGTDTWVGDVWCFTVSEWVHRNIGIDPINEDAPEPPLGSSTYDPATDTTVVNAGGHELWGDNDEFAYRYTTVKMTRDTGMIQARIQSITPADSWRRGGVMIRENLGVASRKFMMHKTGHNNLRPQYRNNWRAGTGSIGNNWDRPYPMWVRVTRDHDRFDGYFSEDGENWTHAGGTNVWMEPDKFVYIGLAQCHHPGVDQSGLSTGTFDSFSYTTPDIKQSWNLQPPNGSTMVNIHATLTWGAGEGATQHLVYFSADEEAVVNRTVEPTVLPAETTELYVGPLDLGQTYYWCVDEVINPVTPGEVVSFTAEEYRLIDDFESYDVGPEELPVQVMTPGEVLVEAVPPPDQAWIEPVVLIEAIEPDPDCLVSRWDFEGDYTDSANGNDGTPQGDATIVVDAERGNVLSLDGDGDYVDCGNPANLDFGTGNWAVSAWVNTTVTGKPKGVIYAKGGDDGNGIRYTLGVGESKSNRVTLTVDDNADKYQSHGSTHVTDGVWHHVLGVRNGDRIYIYTDGQLEDNDGIGAGYDLSGTSQREALIGAIWEHGKDYIDKWYTGLIDDVRVYNCALSLENARYLAEIGDLVKPGYYGPTIVHWAMDEGSGDTATDSSGNGLDGAIVGTAWTPITADGSAACLDFEGGAHVVNEVAGPYLNNLDALTISMWIQSDVTNTDKGFFHGRAPSGNDERGIRYDKSGATCGGVDIIKYGVSTNEGSQQTESSENLQTTEWQHVLLTWESGVGTTLYINGLFVDPNCASYPDVRTGLTSGYTKLLIGKGGKDGAADAGWDGRIDDVRILDYVVTEGERRWLAGIGNIALPDRYEPMISHHQFENDYTDSTDNNFDGTPLDGVSIVDDPTKGLVANFVGVNGSVDIGDSEMYNPTDNMTISAWVNLNSWGGGWGNVIMGKRGEGGVGWQLRRFGGDPRFSFTTRGIGDDDYPRSNLVPNMNQWYHLGAVRDGNQKRLYIDGVLDSTGNTNWNRITPCDHTVYIGARANGGNTGPESHFDGKIDEVRFYNSALTLGQIRELAGYVPFKDIGDTWSGRAAAAPALEYLSPAHEGNYSMRVDYTGSGAVTRLEPFGDGKHPHGWNGDFSLGKAQALSLWFRGDPDNAPGTMFAQLTTVVPSGHIQRVMYDGDPEDLQQPGWQEWTMSLKALSTGKPADPIDEMGLPITKIKDVGVGIIGAGGGSLYFDDLRLYPTRCVPKYGPAYDLTDDCVVDREDMGVIAKAWLAEEGGNGLWYEYYEGYWSVLPYFPGLPLVTQGTADNFGVGQAERGDYFGLRFTGIVAAPVGGDYTFYINSDDGSRLYIDGAVVVDYDGLHGMGGPIAGSVNLDAGEHMIEVIMFEYGGGEGLTVEVEGPGIPRMSIPNEVLFIAPGIPADLNGDGIVNFLDYADVLNHFGDEALFPPPGEQL